MASGSCQHRCLFTLLSAFILAWLAGAGGVFADPDPGVIQDQSTTTTGSSSSAAAAAAAAAAASSASGGAPPPVVAPPPGPIVPPLLPGAGAGAGFNFNKHLNIEGGLGSLFGGLFPGLGFGGVAPPPLVGEPLPGEPLPPPLGDPLGGGGYLGMPWFLGPQYIPATWFGSALAAKGDLLFPIAIFLFAVVGVIFVVKFLLALLVPFLAKKWAIAEAFTHKARRSTADVPQDVTKAHQAHVDELTHKVLPATSKHDHHNRFSDSDSDHDDEDDEFDG